MLSSGVSRRSFFGLSFRVSGAAAATVTGVKDQVQPVAELPLETSRRAHRVLGLFDKTPVQLIDLQEQSPIDFLAEAAKLEQLNVPAASELGKAIRDKFSLTRQALLDVKATLPALCEREWRCQEWIALTRPADLKKWRSYRNVVSAMGNTDALPGVNGAMLAEQALSLTPDELLTAHRAHFEATIMQAFSAVRQAARTAGVDWKMTDLKLDTKSLLASVHSPNAMRGLNAHPADLLWRHTRCNILNRLQERRFDTAKRLEGAGFDVGYVHAYDGRDDVTFIRRDSFRDLAKDPITMGKKLGEELLATCQANTTQLIRDINTRYIRQLTCKISKEEGWLHEDAEFLRRVAAEFTDGNAQLLSREFSPRELDVFFGDHLQGILRRTSEFASEPLKEKLCRAIEKLQSSPIMTLLEGVHSEAVLSLKVA